ncbi:hypothetical protein RRG08_058923 [Elysia crispata]|uniref:Uncharacterized protein n=1 Tax=Elysia crispata TaxID=231223 RepID=A0AAE0XRN1_9GAST|nr:hypothetical protein RRG08_058923 [Elysia crispata]
MKDNSWKSMALEACTQLLTMNLAMAIYIRISLCRNRRVLNLCGHAAKNVGPPSPPPFKVAGSLLQSKNASSP